MTKKSRQKFVVNMTLLICSSSFLSIYFWRIELLVLQESTYRLIYKNFFTVSCSIKQYFQSQHFLVRKWNGSWWKILQLIENSPHKFPRLFDKRNLISRTCSIFRSFDLFEVYLTMQMYILHYAIQIWVYILYKQSSRRVLEKRCS